MSSNAGINETKTKPLSDLLFSYFRNIFQHFLRNYDDVTHILEIVKTLTHMEENTWYVIKIFS